MHRLLDDDLLTGTHEVVSSLRPHRVLRPVSSVDEAVATASHLCQVWAGTGAPLISTASGIVPDYLVRAALEAEIDGYVGDLPLNSDIRNYLEDVHHPWDYPAALVAAHRSRDDFDPIEVVTLGADDPWRLSYLAVLGTLPIDLDESLCQIAGLGALRYDDAFPVHRVSAQGSLDDLLNRLSRAEHRTARELSSYFLAVGREPNSGFLGGESALPSRWEAAQAAGPNIIVVMSPDDTDDFALLWNLRGTWGETRAMPIGIPRDQLDSDALSRLHQPGVATFFGFSGGHLYLTSSSLDLAELSTLAARGSGVEVAHPADLLRFGSAPARRHSSVQTWTEGAARIVPLTDDDRHVLSASARRPPSLYAAVEVPARPMPTLGTLRSQFSAGMVGGAVPLQVPSLPQRDAAIDVRWPSGWTALSAAAEANGLEVRPSQPGVAAMALLRALGDTREAYFLSDPAINSMLYSLAELSGMSWWKGRWNRVERALRERGLTEADVENFAVEQGRHDPVISPPHEGRTLSFSAIKECIGDRVASEKWVAWALEKRLLVKGVGLSCTSCRADFWVPVAEIAPPHVCPGCGRTIPQPFGVSTMNFTYRLGEVVRRCLELDSFGHVLALRWLTDLFDAHGLVGAHPGAEFTRKGRVVAEVDVIVLLQDGSLVPVEVKRRATGFDDGAAQQLDSISELLNAPFDVAAVLDSVPPDDSLRSRTRDLPDRPRFLLTAEHFGMSRIFWGLGANPFSAPESDQDVLVAQHEQWIRAVRSIGERPTDPFIETVGLWRDKRSAGE